MKDENGKKPFFFPQWADTAAKMLTAAVAAGGLYFVALAVYAGSPLSLDVGYRPKQPVEYSHAMHAGELGIDCRYCHSTVERAARAAIPPTQTCMNCHATINVESEKMIPVRESYTTGMPIQWVRVHDLPDYVYFDHSAHVTRGISCVSCHDRVDTMEVVYQAKPLRMSWCLDCHRHPEKHLRPVEYVTKLGWVPMEDQVKMGLRIKEENNINPPTDCSACHR